jgi:hypothetical protein
MTATSNTARRGVSSAGVTYPRLSQIIAITESLMRQLALVKESMNLRGV